MQNDHQSSLRLLTNEYAIAQESQVLFTSGVGSCVVIVMWDLQSKVGAMAHISQPSVGAFEEYPIGVNPEATIPFLLEKVVLTGGKPSSLKLLITGGGNMFEGPTGPAQIGESLVVQTKAILKKLNLSLSYEDTGGRFGRNVHFSLSTGCVRIKNTNGKIKEWSLCDE